MTKHMIQAIKALPKKYTRDGVEFHEYRYLGIVFAAQKDMRPIKWSVSTNKWVEIPIS